MATIDEGAVRKRLETTGLKKKALDALIDGAAEALATQEAGESGWFGIKAPRADEKAKNPAKGLELTRKVAAMFDDGDGEPEQRQAVALEAVAQAVAGAIAEGEGADELTFAGVTYGVKLMEPKRGGRSVVRFKPPQAEEPADEGGEGDEGASE